MKATEVHFLKVTLETKNLNSLAAPELMKKFEEMINNHCCDLVIDCLSVEKIDSSGLNLFLKLNRLLRGFGCRLVLTNANAPVKMIITVARVDEVVPYKDGLLEALGYLKQQNH